MVDGLDRRQPVQYRMYCLDDENGSSCCCSGGGVSSARSTTTTTTTRTTTPADNDQPIHIACNAETDDEPKMNQNGCCDCCSCRCSSPSPSRLSPPSVHQGHYHHHYHHHHRRKNFVRSRHHHLHDRCRRRRLPPPPRYLQSSSTLPSSLLVRMGIILVLLCCGGGRSFVSATAAYAADRDPGSDSQQQHHQQHPQQQINPLIRIGLINGGSSFFEPVADGWNHSCKSMRTVASTTLSSSSRSQSNPTTEDDQRRKYVAPAIVDCLLATPNVDVNDTCLAKIEWAKSWIIDDGVNGIGMKPCYDNSVEPDTFENFVRWAWQYGNVPVVTFDRDVDSPQNSSRAAYVGTDQTFLGRTMARLLKQLRPEGGTYGLVGLKDGRVEGFEEEAQSDNGRDDRAHWTHVEPRIADIYVGSNDVYGDALDWMQYYANQNVTALVVFTQTPMKHERWTSFVEKYRDNITFLGTDGSEWQLDYLNQKLVDGLVGQLPWAIGDQIARRLVEAVQVVRSYSESSSSSSASRDSSSTPREQESVLIHPSDLLPQDSYATNLVAYNLIPREWPDFSIDQHLLNGWKYVGPTLFGCLCIYVLLCIGWTIRQRHHRSHTPHFTITTPIQEKLLITTAFGVLVMSAIIIPLSWDDGGNPDDVSERAAIAVCMSRVWLFLTGFQITLCSLTYLAYGYRIPIAASESGQRQKHCPRLLPPILIAIFMFSNIIITAAWTVKDPLIYKRIRDSATDLWNREISTSGYCVPSSGEASMAFFTPLFILHVAAVIVACWQAIAIRNVKVGNAFLQLNDPRYTSLAIGSLAQGFCTGMPMALVVRTLPLAHYLVTTVILSLLSVVCLSFVFIPRILAQRRYSKLTEKGQKILAMLTKQQNIDELVDESNAFEPSADLAPFSGKMEKEKATGALRREVSPKNDITAAMTNMMQSAKESIVTEVHSNMKSEDHFCTVKATPSTPVHDNSATTLFQKIVSITSTDGSDNVETDWIKFLKKVDKSALTAAERDALEAALLHG